jgi:hypothetical protein
MVARRRHAGAMATRLRLTAGAALALAAPAPAAGAHPLHTSFAEVAYDAATRTVTVSLRVFADDFGADVARRTGAAPGAGGVPADEAVYRYLAARFTVVTARGEALPFRGCGARRAGVQLFVCLRAPAAAPPAGARVRSAILSETFADQVNIVQASLGGRRQTLLFTRGDGAKSL